MSLYFKNSIGAYIALSDIATYQSFSRELQYFTILFTFVGERFVVIASINA